MVGWSHNAPFSSSRKPLFLPVNISANFSLASSTGMHFQSTCSSMDAKALEKVCVNDPSNSFWCRSVIMVASSFPALELESQNLLDEVADESSKLESPFDGRGNTSRRCSTPFLILIAAFLVANIIWYWNYKSLVGRTNEGHMAYCGSLSEAVENIAISSLTIRRWCSVRHTHSI